VQAARAQWRQSQPALEVTKLVFLDETGATTNMTRTHGRSPCGQRCIACVPHGHWQTTTFVAGLRVGGITAPLVLDGPMDGEAFVLYGRECLAPTLKPGDLVIADNLPSHKVAGVTKAIEAAGATLRHLPPYSPDFNPIAQLCATLKALLRKAAHRTVEALWRQVGTLLDAVTPDECANYFTASGYVNT